MGCYGRAVEDRFWVCAKILWAISGAFRPLAWFLPRFYQVIAGLEVKHAAALAIPSRSSVWFCPLRWVQAPSGAQGKLVLGGRTYGRDGHGALGELFWLHFQAQRGVIGEATWRWLMAWPRLAIKGA